ncbi:MAG: hypothetical protein V4685_18935 [Bacteroidota bacterium]
MKKATDQSKEEELQSVPDLKHDTMEFAASRDGDDKLDFDDDTYEEEEITPEELDNMKEGSIEEQGYALVAAQTDKTADEDNLPEENWEDDLPDNEGPADKTTALDHPEEDNDV